MAELDRQICTWQGWHYKNRPTHCCQMASWDMVKWPVFGPRGGGYHNFTPPPYSTDDNEALKLMKRLKPHGFDFQIETTEGGWKVVVTTPAGLSHEAEDDVMAKAFAIALVSAIDDGVPNPDVEERKSFSVTGN